MKKIIAILMMVLFLTPSIAFTQDKDTLVMRRDLAQERVLRMQAELGLMKVQFQNGQEMLRAVSKELQDLNAKLKALEEKKVEKKK